MRRFLIRARRAPTDSRRFLAAIGSDRQVEVLAQCVINGMLIANDHRRGVVIHLALESGAGLPKVITFDSDRVGNMGGHRERGVLELLAHALAAGRKLEKNEKIQVDTGISVEAASFEHLVQKSSDQSPLYLLDPGGEDIRTIDFGGDCSFVLTDHLAMPRKVRNSMRRLADRVVSVGRRTLFASQCLVLIHDELDRRT